MKFLNLPPHAINVEVQTGDFPLCIPPSGILPRVKTETRTVGETDGIRLTSTEAYEIVDLVPEEEGVMLIVSAMVRTAAPERKDLVSPSGLTRDAAGRVTGCTGFDIN